MRWVLFLLLEKNELRRLREEKEQLHNVINWFSSSLIILLITSFLHTPILRTFFSSRLWLWLVYFSRLDCLFNSVRLVIFTSFRRVSFPFRVHIALIVPSPWAHSVVFKKHTSALLSHSLLHLAVARQRTSCRLEREEMCWQGRQFICRIIFDYTHTPVHVRHSVTNSHINPPFGYLLIKLTLPAVWGEWIIFECVVKCFETSQKWKKKSSEKKGSRKISQIAPSLRTCVQCRHWIRRGNGTVLLLLTSQKSERFTRMSIGRGWVSFSYLTRPLRTSTRNSCIFQRVSIS